MQKTAKNRLTLKQKRFLEIFIKKLCNVSQTCSAMNISRSLLYKWVNNNDTFRDKKNEAEKGIVDDVESVLYQKIFEKNDTACIIFFLKSKAKDRGYTEKLEIDNEHKVIDPVQVWLPSNGRETNTKKSDK